MNDVVHVLVLMDYGRGLKTWKNRKARNQVSESVPYGYRSSNSDWQIEFSEDANENWFMNRSRRLLSRILGFDLVHVWRHRRQAGRADIVWTHTEQIHLAYTALSQLVRRMAPAIAQSVWLPEELAAKPPHRALLKRWLLKRSTINVSLSPSNRELLEQLAPSTDPTFVAFGISPDPFEGIPNPVREPEARLKVLGLGNDRHRDWDTLVAAARLLQPSAEFLILSGTPSSEPLPENVRQRRATSFEDVREAYLWADIVCLPLAQNAHASGVTVALEAIFANRPLLVNNVGGLDAYFPHLSPMFMPADATPREWAARLASIHDGYDELASLLKKAALLDVRENELSSEGYSRRLITLSKRILAGG